MLDKQVVSIPFTKGMDTKTDDKLVLPGTLTLAENAVFTKQGQVKKRNGYDALVKSYTYPKGIADFGNELLAFANDKVYSYSENNTEWIDKGFCQNIALSTEIYGNNISNNFSQSFAKYENIYAIAYTGYYYDTATNTNKIRAFLNVKDHSTGVLYVKDFNLSVDITSPFIAAPDIKILAIDGEFCVFYAVDGTLYKRTFSVSDPSNISSASIVAVDFYYGLNVKDYNEEYYISYINNISEAHIHKYNKYGAYMSDVVFSKAFPLLDCSILVYSDEIHLLYTSIAGASTGYARLDVNSFVIINDIPLYGSYLYNPTITRKGSNIVVFGEYGYSGLPALVKGEFNSSGVVSAISVVKYNTKMLSEAFTVEDRPYVCVQTNSGYILNENGNVICTFCRESIGVDLGFSTDLLLLSVLVDGSKAYFACSKDATAIGEVTLQSYEIDFDPDQNINSKKLGNLLYITGGYLSVYDGNKVTENGFFEIPEIYGSVIKHTTGTPSIPILAITDNYQYSCVYEWVDNQGNLHQSAVSLKDWNGDATIGTYWNEIQVPRLQLSAKETNIKVSLFRTAINQTVPYLVFSCDNSIPVSASPGNPAGNSATAYGLDENYIMFHDNKIDDNIENNRVLYTAGGVLENFIPPAPKNLEIFKNRLVVTSPDSSVDMIWYSKNFAYGYGVGFNEALTLLVNPIGGAITALKFMDDKLLIFKENILYGLGGDGANDLGANNTFSQPEIISSDVGCITQNSLVLMPLGVMFMSNKGIYLCSRQLQISYIGAGVENYNDLTVMSGDLLQDKNQIRFLTRDGVALLYDYYFDNWGTFTNHQGIDATVWRGVYTYMRTDGTIYTEGTSGLDDATTFSMKIRTAWLKFAGLQGFQRVRRFAFLGGELESNHVLKISLRYDYESYDSDTIIFDVGPLFSTMYGSGVYGDMSVYGGDENGVYQFRGHMPRQKCESVQFTFEDIAGVEAKGTYSISDLALEVGLKRGLNKMKLSRTVG